MSEATPRIVINHGLEPAGTKRKPGAESEARARNKAAEEEIRARRRVIHDQAERDITGAKEVQEQAEPVETPIREDIESIEIPLPDGRVVEYGPPVGISLSDRISRLYSGRAIQDGGPDPGATEYRLTRVLMCVRSIDGKPVAAISDLIQKTMLANKLGDVAIDLLFYFDRLHWPPLTQAELPAVRKFLRQSRVQRDLNGS